MSNANEATSAGPVGAAGRPRRGAPSLWGALACIVVTALLFALFPGRLFWPLFVLAGAAGVVGLLLSLVAQRAGRGAASTGRTGSAAGWARVFAILAGLVNLVLIAIIVVGVVSRPQLTQVEVRAQGGPTFTVTFADDTQSYVEEWLSSGWKQFTTTKSTAEITVQAPPGGGQLPVSCQIFWNGELVSDETSESGRVACRYEAR